MDMFSLDDKKGPDVDPFKLKGDPMTGFAEKADPLGFGGNVPSDPVGFGQNLKTDSMGLPIFDDPKPKNELTSIGEFGLEKKAPLPDFEEFDDDPMGVEAKPKKKKSSSGKNKKKNAKKNKNKNKKKGNKKKKDGVKAASSGNAVFDPFG